MINKSSAYKRGLYSKLAPLTRMSFVIGLFLLTAGVNDSRGQALFQQTREQCDECCKKSGYDDYYLEQCRLKCFRNHDYCMGPKGSHAEPSANKPETPVQTTRPPSERPVEQPEPQPQQQVQKPKFVWPNPLNLIPGREGEAAAHILALNGIPPQHPNYARAMGAIQGILINFARNNPSGGALPTAQLQQIISQLR
ncbi:MAG: hypothetical protein M0T73_04070 [Deltaproteobacteria bacterium]|nr:hypothetical protein [Deltaproteobacteria bacterium]